MTVGATKLTDDGAYWTIRAPARHELDVLIECVEAGFAITYDAEQRAQFRAGLDADRCLVAIVDGCVVGTLASHAIDQTLVGPTTASCASVTDVTVVPAHRNRGIFAALVKRFLHDAYRRGEAIAVLAASRSDLYGRYGFGVATWAVTGEIDCRGADSPASRHRDGDVVLLSTEEALQALPEVFEVVRADRPGELSRPLAVLRELIEDLPTEDRRQVAAYVQRGIIEGYAIYDRPDRRVLGRHTSPLVHEITATSDGPRIQLWAHLCRQGSGIVRFSELARDELDFAARAGARQRSSRTIDRTWNRLIHVRAALAARRYTGPGDVVVEVHDPICHWNSGRLLLSVDDDGAGVTSATTADPDIVLGVGALATLFAGASPPSELAARGLLDERVRGSAERVEALFAADVVPFCSAVC